jgi:NNP family nitrate/nitrite transporter-like MFS transporter
MLAHEPPRRAPGRARLPSYRDTDLRWLCLFYMITFGGYVGLASFLPLFWRDAYGVAPIDAGYITAGLACAGSLARPLGGFIADRIGGARLLAMLLFPIALAYAFASSVPALPLMVATLAVTMVCLGLGNGAVFQIVPLRFAHDLGAVTGVIGAIGGIGGFLLPSLLGSVHHVTGSFAGGFAVLGCIAAAGAIAARLLAGAGGRWARIEVLRAP